MIHQRDIVSCICYHVLSQRFSWGIYCLASVIVQFHKDSPEGCSVLHLLSFSFIKIHQKGYCVLHLLACSFTNILQREIVSCICYHVVSQDSSEGYSVLHLLSCSFAKIHQRDIVVSHLLSCSFAKIHQRDIVSCICSHVITQRFTRGIQCLASVIMQFHKDSPKGYSVLHLLSCSFAKIIQRDIVSCICYRVVSQRFSRGIQCLVSVIMQFREDSPEGYSGLASVIMQFRKDSPEGYSVLHLLSCSFAKIHQRDIVSCICQHVVSQIFPRGMQCLASVIIWLHKDSPEGYSIQHLLSCIITNIHQRDIVSCICYHVVSQRFTREIQCLAPVFMQFHNDSPEGYSVLHLLSCNYHKDSPGGYIVLHLLSCSFTKIHQKDIVCCICQHVVSQRFTRGMWCLASVIMQFHKDSPEGYSVLHLLSCSFAEIHQRDIVSCICQHVVSQIFPRGIQCLASVIIWLHKDSPEGYSIQHLLSCIITNIHQRDIVSCICYHVVSQRFTREIQCLAPVFMQFHNDSPEGYSVLHLLS